MRSAPSVRDASKATGARRIGLPRSEVDGRGSIFVVVVSERLLREVRPTIQIPQDSFAHLALEPDAFDPRDRFAVAQPHVQKPRDRLRVCVLGERPCRLIARSDSGIENYHADAGHT